MMKWTIQILMFLFLLIAFPTSICAQEVVENGLPTTSCYFDDSQGRLCVASIYNEKGDWSWGPVTFYNTDANGNEVQTYYRASYSITRDGKKGIRMLPHDSALFELFNQCKDRNGAGAFIFSKDKRMHKWYANHAGYVYPRDKKDW